MKIPFGALFRVGLSKILDCVLRDSYFSGKILSQRIQLSKLRRLKHVVVMTNTSIIRCLIFRSPHGTNEATYRSTDDVQRSYIKQVFQVSMVEVKNIFQPNGEDLE